MKKERPIKMTFRPTRKEIETELNGGKPLSNYHYRLVRKFIKRFDGDNTLLLSQLNFYDLLTENMSPDILPPKEIKELL